MKKIEYIKDNLFSTVSGQSLGVLRILIGFCLLDTALKFLINDFDKIKKLSHLRIYFKFWGFEFVQPMEDVYMKAMIVLMVVLSVFIIVGLLYHLCMFMYGVCFAYIFYLEMTVYLNHYYLMWLMCIVLSFMPLNACFSLDRFIFQRKDDGVYYISYFMIRVEMAIVYFYAGVAKMNIDWLIRGEPLAHWLSDLTYLPVVGPYLTHPWNGVVFSWAGFLLDLVLGPLSMHPKYKWFAITFTSMFHLSNMQLWNIGIFPWFMLSITTVFFSPNWSEKLPFIGKSKFEKKKRGDGKVWENLVLIICAIFLLHQVVIPLRHHLIEGDVNWTEEGHFYSWRMKLRDKQGSIEYFLTDPITNNTSKIHMSHLLTEGQLIATSCRSDHIQILAHNLAQRYYDEKQIWPKVTAQAICSLNFRPFQHMVNSSVDLVSTPLWQYPKKWVLPLVDPWTGFHKDCPDCVVSNEAYLQIMERLRTEKAAQNKLWTETIRNGKNLNWLHLY
eukprot:TRINITY_DN5487_c0_g1_i1.p1 TRINITY_DN5487_c0_g1~~TRINITY_DN5487_c0_g1_i1.p1  ORF type:complete len:498 (-),score=62.32 TRINITY_DN5487_c0_g1_i1:11-1504(-)